MAGMPLADALVSFLRADPPDAGQNTGVPFIQSSKQVALLLQRGRAMLCVCQ